jgi:hypothetical protein
VNTIKPSHSHCWWLLLCLSFVTSAEERIEIVGRIDGTDQITFRQDAANWEHLFGDLWVTEVRVNGVLWQPSQNLTLENSGATAYLADKVNFLAARLELLEGRDTVVLERQPGHIVLSIADTPGGADNYSVVITFPESPTLLVEGEIDGSDELHISYAGASWFHKHWGWPTEVRLNGIAWDPAVVPFLVNDGTTVFLPQPVDFRNAVVLERSGRDLMTVNPGRDGLIINFADNPVGAGRYSVLIGFPPDQSLPNASIPVIPRAELTILRNAAIWVDTVRGLWYELESTLDLSANTWESTGTFIHGSGATMTMFDPTGNDATKFYRVVCRLQPY